MLLLLVLPLLSMLLLSMLLITHQVACYLVNTCHYNHAALLRVYHNHIHAQYV